MNIKDVAVPTYLVRDVVKDFSVAALAKQVLVSSGGSSNLTLNHASVTRNTGASYNNLSDVQVTVPLATPFGNLTFTFTNETPSIVSIDSAGVVTRVANGTASILVEVPHIGKRRIYFTSTQLIGSVVDVFNNFTAGSVEKHCADAIDALLVGKSPSNRDLLSSRNDTTGTYAWNTSRWCAPIDLTCVSFWNSSDGIYKAGTLITAKHIIYADHYKIPDGTTLRFVKLDGTVVTRTTVSNGRIGSTSDFHISVLDSDVPSGIGICSVLPANAGSYFLSESYGVPGLTLNQFKRAGVSELIYMDNEYVGYKKPIDSTRLSFHEDVIDRDSGNPSFLIINGVPVLMTTWQGGPDGTGSSILYNRAAIALAVAPYSLTDAVLTSFTT